ncbi:OstA-like protein [Marinilabilia rubra]|uniref:Organic solvent tolerance protein OstA n=1 Tax=Marinilabilia rubra TaxID=2162893 RepID=A0A2U2B680_9BACT|nr:OstA-like protein [Marinilabilia rubra]PWD98581.1 organic solvent tolerance protein OstA [Marinilabilia rubra]
MNSENLLFLFLFSLLLAPSAGFAQQKKEGKSTILIEYADFLEGAEKRLGKNVQALKGDVKMRHLNTEMFCDSAILYRDSNKVDAFGSIHVIQNDSIHLYGNRLHYDGDEELAKVRENVKLVNKKVVLTTEFLDYDRRNDVAYYFNGGKIVDETNQLTSRLGFYYPRTAEVNFKDSVVLVNPDYKMYSDTLKYFTKTEVVEIVGPTDIVSDQNTIYSELGFYNTKTDIAHLLKNNYIDGGEQTLRGDTIYYDRNNGFGEVFSAMALEDTANNVIITGDYGYYNEKTENALATKRAVLKQVYGRDTLFLHADTLRADPIEDDPENKLVRAFHHVQFYRRDLQGRCDSMVYDFRDSTNTFFHEPIIWAQGNQMTANKIKLYTREKTLYKAEMIDNAFLIAPEDTLHFNQIKGNLMTGFFRDNQLYRIDVDGNGQTVYYPKDREYVIGVNRAESSKLTIFLNERKVETIILRTQPSGNMNPPLVLDEESTRLDGFLWLEKYRPQEYEAIFDFMTIEEDRQQTDYSDYHFE